MTALIDTVDRAAFPPLRRTRLLVGPSTTYVVMGSAAVMASLSPGMLPRPAWLQGAFTALLLLVMVAAMRMAARLPIVRVTHRGLPRSPFASSTGVRVRFVAVVMTMGAVGAVHLWQNRLRDATGVERIGLDYWYDVSVVATGVVVTVLTVAHWCRRGWAHGRRRRRDRRRMAAASTPGPAMGAALLVSVFLLGFAPTVGSSEPTAAATNHATATAGTSATTGTTAVAGTSATTGGDPGAHGRAFLADGPAEQVRVYIPSDAAADPVSRAEMAITELDAARAWDRAVLLVAVPTGSGWVDTAALRGFTERFGTDTAVVAAAYSSMPSWLASLVARDKAVDTTRELLARIDQRISALPPRNRPTVVLYGQSLGAAAGAEAVHSLSEDMASETAGCLSQFLVGPPTGTPIAEGAQVLANQSDPVVVWSPQLLIEPPSAADRRPDAPQPPWLPVLSFLQTTVDMAVALGPGPGHGHRYGTDQVDGPLYCAAAPSSAADRATSNAAPTR